jgi:hypothetical protein
MTLREIVDDVELQRIAVLKNNSKRANQQLKGRTGQIENGEGQTSNVESSNAISGLTSRILRSLT